MSKKVDNAVRSALVARDEKAELTRLRKRVQELEAKPAAPAPSAAPTPPAAPQDEPGTPDLQTQIATIAKSADEAIARGHGRHVEHKRNHLIATIAKAENARALFRDNHHTKGDQ